MDNLEQRLAQLESRLIRIERHLNLTAPTPQTNDTFSFRSPAQETGKPSAQPERPAASPVTSSPSSLGRRPPRTGTLIARLLGWGGALALVSAAAYLIKLAYESGWLALSPQMRIGFAVAGGLSLIATGLYLRRKDRQYASLLPAAGIVILFLSVYGAHLYYRFIASGSAATGVILTCMLSLWLCRLFNGDLYALFAIVGSYSAPFLLDIPIQQVGRLILYYSAWSIVFCLFSLHIGKRRYYLLALYLAIVGFDLIWRWNIRYQWQAALGYQTIQMTIFLACTVLFSIRHRRPLDRSSAALHLPALVIFYILQYSLLERHIPRFAPWIALASVAVIGSCYLIPRLILKRELPGGRLLLTCYGSLALIHAGYLEILPHSMRPWIALLALPALLVWAAANRRNIFSDWPLLAALGLLWLANYMQVVGNELSSRIAGHRIIAFFHALELYAGYALLRSRRRMNRFVMGGLIYLGHFAAMAAAWQILRNSLGVSLAWGLLALICLGLSLSLRDRMLGHSSLLLFAFSALKVLFHDLSDALPAVRIGCLLVVGITFYTGGWLYRYIEGMTPPRAR
ncbi:MAG: hypothetical protein PWP34_701 [Desulfuromonadales bacterium]|jgi:uncharacterized membrane protein|nr:hypothetical protein [Desulfuromonadales bacterium]